MGANQPGHPVPGGLPAGRGVRVEGEADGPPKRPQRGGPARQPSDETRRESEQHFRAVAEGSPIPTFAIDRDHRVIAWNHALEEYTGVPAADALGTNDCWRAFYPSERPCMADLIVDGAVDQIAAWYKDRCSRSSVVRGAYEATDYFPHMKGGCWLFFTAAPLLDTEGQIIGAVETLQDVTETRRAEEALRESEQRFHQVAENAQEWIWETDAHGRYTYASVAVRQILGYEPEEIVGRKRFYDLFHPEDAEELKRGALRAFAEKRAFREFPNRNVHKNGTEVWLLTSGMPLLDDRGHLLGYRGADVDITQSKRAEAALRASEERYRLAQRLSGVGTWEWNVATGEVYWSDEVVSMWGFRSGKFGGAYEDVVGAVHPDDLQRWQENVRACVEDGQEHHIEFRIVWPDGTVRWVAAAGDAERGAGGRAVRMLGVVMDVTDRRLAEEEIRRLNQDLERRVRKRTALLQEANRELEAFAYSVSHDLRAPLRHVSGFAHLLHKHAADALDQPARRYLDHIAEAADQMGTLIDDLLAFSRMGRAELRTVPVDLRRLVEAVVRDMGPDLRGRKIDWRIGELPTVLGDLSMLRQVLANLLLNAVKFTAHRPVARIDVRAREDAGEVVVSVSDNGVGFDAKYVDKLFGLFQRLHRREDFPGTGVGLANVRRIVHRHGGRTWAEGAVNRGATFHFSLPRNPQTSRPPQK